MAEFMDFANAIQQESGDIAGSLQGLYQANEQKKMALSFGEQKKAMVEFAKQSGMPQGFDYIINQAKTPEDLAVATKQIVSYNKETEGYGRMAGAVGTVSAIDQVDVRNTVLKNLNFTEEDARNPLNIYEFQSGIQDEINRRTTGAIVGGVKTLDEAKGAKSLLGSTGSSIDPYKVANLQSSIDDKLTRNENLAKSYVNKVLSQKLAYDKKGLEALSASVPAMVNLENKIQDAGFENFDEMAQFRLMGLVGLPDNKIGDALRKMSSSIGLSEEVTKETEKKLIDVQNAIHQFMLNFLQARSGATVTQQEKDDYLRQFGRSTFSRNDQWVSTVLNIAGDALARLDRIEYSFANDNTSFRLPGGERATVYEAYNNVYGKSLDRDRQVLEQITQMLKSARESGDGMVVAEPPPVKPPVKPPARQPKNPIQTTPQGREGFKKMTLEELDKLLGSTPTPNN